ncbi:hypothetical protein G7Y89_g10970 [Cudoniella acicularis]|uniref:Uncharacterized protein n=1 Tax=Cudoniella acicularis TaxID=354080 RepID=A0A8H4RCU1_9HELO|nr:hypothetical protein G7Y89_g10970 [Cudoniella acicularis]
MEEDVSHPDSTWDVFNNLIPTLSNLPSPQNALSSTDGPLVIDLEMAELLQEYQRGIGPWMDLFDHDLSYQRGVMRRAHSSPLIMQALCALTAKQLSMVTRGEVWEAVAACYYGESLRLLINVLADTALCRQDALVATILLSSYELLASPGLDHRRHVSGALTLIKTHDFTARSKCLERASFWVYARLDIAMALIHECPTMLPPEEWNVCWAKQETEEDVLANQILWILAKIIAFTFQKGETLPEANLSTSRSKLLAEITTWFDDLPSSLKGIPYGSPSREGFVKHWFAVPASGQCHITIPRLD